MYRTPTNLEEVRDYLGSIANINSGGCGLAAYAMYLWLEANNLLNSDTTIVYGHGDRHYDMQILKHNKDFLKGKRIDATTCTHCVLYHEGVEMDTDVNYLFDDWSDSNYKIVEKLYIPANEVHKFMISSLSGDGWNSMFDFCYHLPKIEMKLGINFNLN